MAPVRTVVSRPAVRPETSSLAQTLREVQDIQGFAILLVEHDVEFVRSFSSRLFVLDFGNLIATWLPALDGVVGKHAHDLERSA